MDFKELPDCSWCGHPEITHHATGPCLETRCACEMYEQGVEEYMFDERAM